MPYKRILSFFSKGSERTVKAKTNILFSFFLKGISNIIGFIFVPLTLNYLGTEEYGIWLTLSSILLWFGFFDIGLGNGLRNKLAESLAKNDFKMAKIYVSTTYAGIAIIFSVVLLIFFIINPFLNWAHILNTSPDLSGMISKLAIFLVVFLSIRFVVQLISTINYAHQNPSISSSFDVLANLISLGFLILLKTLSIKSLLLLGIVFSASPVIVFTVASYIFYRGRYKLITPSIRSVEFKYLKELGGLGVNFLFIQLAYLIIFTLNNFIISYLFGPEKVTIFSIPYKYFGFLSNYFLTLLLPFWSAFTDAYVKKDISWIRNALKRLIGIWVIFVILIIVLIIGSSFLYPLWLRNNFVKVPFMLSVFMGIFYAIFAWFNIFCFFINGTGKVKLQLLVYIIAALLEIPLILFLSVYLHFNLYGVIITNIIVSIPIAVFMPIQTYKIINGTAKGIWNK
jgi:O-antigen/teichoic acid export membrane protein